MSESLIPNRFVVKMANSENDQLGWTILYEGAEYTVAARKQAVAKNLEHTTCLLCYRDEELLQVKT